MSNPQIESEIVIIIKEIYSPTEYNRSIYKCNNIGKQLNWVNSNYITGRKIETLKTKLNFR